jgi:NAD-dependent SIR2 family protein deacetylase
MINFSSELQINNNIGSIAEQLRKKRVGFLIGVGMSLKSGSIRGDELRYALLRRGLYQSERDMTREIENKIRKISEKYPLEAIAGAITDELPLKDEELKELLTELAFKEEQPKPNEGHKLLSKIISRFKIKILFTTNWDNLIKSALGESAEVITRNNNRIINLDKITEKKTAIIHLHGTFEDMPLVKENDLMDLESPLLQLFLTELMSKVFVFVGYSMNDPNIKAIYYRTKDLLDRKKVINKKTYIVYPPEDHDKHEIYINKKIWSARNIEYIPLSAEDFFRMLYEESVVRKMKEVRARLATKLGINEDQLNIKITEYLNVFPGFGTEEQVLDYLEEIV